MSSSGPTWAEHGDVYDFANKILFDNLRMELVTCKSKDNSQSFTKFSTFLETVGRLVPVNVLSKASDS